MRWRAPFDAGGAYVGDGEHEAERVGVADAKARAARLALRMVLGENRTHAKHTNRQTPNTHAVPESFADGRDHHVAVRGHHRPVVEAAVGARLQKQHRQHR
jgi:hypothetical protein